MMRKGGASGWFQNLKEEDSSIGFILEIDPLASIGA
jgi:hypothetical protein